jgi:plastocyanin
MHGTALAFISVLAAEKSKTPFYIAGGVLVAWALILSLALGLRRPAFPGNLIGERVVIAISVVLVLGAVSSAVVTASEPAKAGSQGASSSQPSPAGAPGGAPPGTAVPAGGAPPSSSGAPPSGPAAAGTLKLAADPNGGLSYDTKQLSAKAGRVTIAFTNASSLSHNVTIAQGSTQLGATPTFNGGTRTLTLNLKPGTYTFYCSVPGHRQSGMEGTLHLS